MKLAVRVLLSFGLLAALLFILPWEDVKSSLGLMDPTVWLSVLGIFLAGHFLGAAKWRMLVNGGRRLLSTRDSLRCYSAGLFANLCLPSIVGGDVLRAVLAGKATRRPESVVLGAIADRVSDVIALALLMGVGAMVAREALPGATTRTLATVLGISLLGFVILLPVVGRVPLSRWPRRLRRPAGRALVALRNLRRQPRIALLALTISLSMQSGFVLANAWIGGTLGIDIPIAAWFVVWPAAKIAGLLPISVGGLGVREVTLGSLMVPLGVPMTDGVVTSLVWQTILIAGGLTAGALWYSMSRKSGQWRGFIGETRATS